MDKDEGFDPAINLTGPLPEEFSKEGVGKLKELPIVKINSKRKTCSICFQHLHERDGSGTS